MRLENLFWVGLAAAVVAALAALVLLRRAARLQKGPESARALAGAVRRGLYTFWRHQSLVWGGALVLCLAALAVLLSVKVLPNKLLPLAFLTGGVCAAGCAFAASFICTVAAPRAANRCAKGVGQGFWAAFSASGAAAAATLALALAHVSVWMVLVRAQVGSAPTAIANTAVLFGLGGTLTTLLLRAGSVFARGGVDALIQARQSTELPQDPASVAVLVGYAAGPAAGAAAEAFDAFSLTLLCAMALGSVSYGDDLLFWQTTLLPLLVAAAGLVCSLITPLLLRPQEREDRSTLPRLPRLGLWLSALLTGAMSLPITYALTGSWTLCYPILLGLLAGCFVTLHSDMTTADESKPVRELAEAADQGAARTLLGGLSLGLARACVPVLLLSGVAAVTVLALPGMEGREVYALSLAAVGMLSLSAPALTSALMGPVTDCAKAMSLLTARAQEDTLVCDELAAAGSRGGHAAKGFRAVAGTLAGAVLLGLCAPALGGKVSPLLPTAAPVPVFVIGAVAAVAFLFALGAVLLRAVARAGHTTVQEILRQSRDIPGLAQGEAGPDYDKCTALCAKESVVWMLPPAALTLAAPVAVWLVLGGSALAGFCAGVTLAGPAMALLFTYTGAGLDAARRYLEKGRHGGKNSPWHRAVALCCHLTAAWSDVLAPALPAVVRLCVSVSFLLCSLLVIV